MADKNRYKIAKPKLKSQEPYNFKKISDGMYAVDFSDVIKPNTAYTLTEIEDALNSKDIPTLIKMSNYFYLISGEYRRFVHMMADPHTFDNVIIPKKIFYSTKQQKSKEDILKAFDKVLEYSEDTNIKSACSYITFECVLNGTYYGYEREINGNIVMQELPIDYCRTRSLDEESNYIIEFNFKFFDLYRDEEKKLRALSMFPDEFTKLYSEWLKDKSRDMEWKALDKQYTRCHRLTMDGTPFFCAVFPEILDLKEYKLIDKSKSKLDLYRLITQKVPIDGEGRPLLTPDETKDLHSVTKKMLGGDGLELVTTPMEVDSIDLSNKGEKSDDIIEKGTNSIFNTAGMSRNLSNGTGGAVGLSSSITMDESVIGILYGQYENWYNARFKRITGIGKATDFRISFSRITNNNRKTRLTELKEASTYGASSKMLYAVSATGMTQTEFLSSLYFENDILGLQEIMLPMMSSHTMNSNDMANSGGRPQSDDSEISETTQRQREDETTENRTK